MARPFSTVIFSAQVSGQSCGQAPRTVVVFGWPAEAWGVSMHHYCTATLAAEARNLSNQAVRQGLG
jgi:hypothetical protein